MNQGMDRSGTDAQLDRNRGHQSASADERDMLFFGARRGMVAAWMKPLKRRPDLHAVLGNQTAGQVDRWLDTERLVHDAQRADMLATLDHVSGEVASTITTYEVDRKVNNSRMTALSEFPRSCSLKFPRSRR